VRQMEVRKRLNKFIADEGVTAKFIANKVNIHESNLSKFRRNMSDLYPEQLDTIEIFLNSKQQQSK